MMTDYARGDAQSPAWVAQAQMTRMPSEPFRTIPNHSEVKKWRVISPNLSEVIRSCPKPSGRSIFFGTVDVFVPPPIFRNGYGVTGRIGRICLAECARPRAQQWASGDPA